MPIANEKISRSLITIVVILSMLLLSGCVYNLNYTPNYSELFNKSFNESNSSITIPMNGSDIDEIIATYLNYTNISNSTTTITKVTENYTGPTTFNYTNESNTSANAQENISLKKLSYDNPPIRYANDKEAFITVDLKFLFQENEITTRVYVDKEIYLESKKDPKEFPYYGEPDYIWERHFYLNIINYPSQVQFYEDTLYQLEKIRKDLNLSDDEYAELIVSFVQSIPYDNESTRASTEFPVITLVEYKGVCGDKSAMLSGLLSKANYNVSFFVYDPEDHAAVGISCKDHPYEAGYCFVESTGYYLVNVPPKEYQGGIVLKSSPKILPIGNGTIDYKLGNQTEKIKECFANSEKNIQDFKEQLSRFNFTEESPIGDYDTYNNLVDEYNSNIYLYNYIIENMYNRKGVTDYIAKYGNKIC